MRRRLIFAALLLATGTAVVAAVLSVGRAEQVPIRVPCHGVDIFLVSSERSQASSIAQIPELD